MNIFPNIKEGPLWIFTADKLLNQSQSEDLNQRFASFFTEWNAHGNRVAAEHILLNQRVLFIAADSQVCDVSGCSKDKLYHFLKAAGQAYGIDFFNRMLIPILGEDGLDVVHWNDIESMIQNGELLESTTFVDATAATLQRFRLSGLQPLSSLLISM